MQELFQKLLRIVIFSLVIFCLTGCESAVERLINRKPIIESLTASRLRVYPNESITIKVKAKDPDQDQLSYSWSKTGGDWLTNTTVDTVIWKSPLVADNYTITVTVTDDKGASVEESITIKVIETTSPELSIITPLNNAFIPGIGILIVRANASHQNGIDRVEFYLDNELKCSDTRAPYEWEWDITGLNGDYIIKARAYQAEDPEVNPREVTILVHIEGVSIP